MENRKHLLVGLAYPALLLAMFYFLETTGGFIPFSLDAVIGPFLGEQRLVVLAFVAVSALDLYWYGTTFLPFSLQNKNFVQALAAPSVAAVFGILLAVMERNPWIALPFFAAAFGTYVYAYLKISRNQ
ncbi:hypothetical protein GF318_05800 [Candidatus Micrarchaeota archaeon]|nr:hypothetical protein [Candidatus Micrarchaeota archaeon]